MKRGTVERVNWHNALPSWIRADTAYQELRQSVRHTLQAIANHCDKPEEGCELLLVCFSGERVFTSCGCRRSTFKAHVRKLESLGYVVPLTRGGGRLATIYGIPGERGQLDQHRAEKKAKPRLWRRADSEQLRSLVSGFETLTTPAPLVSGNQTAPVRESDGYCPESGRLLSENRTLPSYVPSSCNSAHKPPLKKRLRSLSNDDDSGGLCGKKSPEEIKTILCRAGVDTGRAHKLANNPLTTPDMVRDVLERASGHPKSNPGGYIGNMMDDALAEARRQYVEDERLLFEAQQQRLVETEASIDTMPDDELQDTIESIPALKGLRPDGLRNDPALRKEVARYLAQHNGQAPSRSVVL